MPSSTNERQIAQRNRTAAKDRQTEIEVTRTLMSAINGRRYCWLFLSRAGLFAEDGDLDHARMCLKVGRRIEALTMLAIINRFCPELYVRMVQENTGVDPTPTEEDEDDGRPLDA